MLKLITSSAAASFLAVAAQATPLSDPHERPDSQWGASEATLSQVEAGRLLNSHDLAESRLSPHDLVSVTTFPSSGSADRSSREDY